MTISEWTFCLLMWSVFYYFAGDHQWLSHDLINSSLSSTSSFCAVLCQFFMFLSLSLLAVVCTTYFPQSQKKVKTAEEFQLRPRAVQSSTCQPIRESQKPNKQHNSCQTEYNTQLDSKLQYLNRAVSLNRQAYLEINPIQLWLKLSAFHH